VRGALDIVRGYLRIAALLPAGGIGLVCALVCLNLILGLLPVVFVVATSVMIGRVPEAVAGGVGSAEWSSLVVTFVIAASAFVVQQMAAPLSSATPKARGASARPRAA